MILHNNYISKEMRNKNLILAVLFIFISFFCHASNSNSLSSKNENAGRGIKEGVVHLQETKSYSSKNSFNKNRKNTTNVFLSLFEIEEEDSSSCSFKAFKLFQNSACINFKIKVVCNTALQSVFSSKNIFSFKKSKLFIEHQSFLI